MAIIYKLALEKNTDIPRRLREFFEKTTMIQDVTERASEIDRLIEKEFKENIFPKSISNNYEIGFIAYVFLSLIYENLSLNLLQQFEMYARYYWINLKKREIEEKAHKIIDGNYSLKKKITNGNNVLSFNEKIVREFSKHKLSYALELFAAIGELYITVLEEFSKEVKDKIESLDRTLSKTELEEVSSKLKKELLIKEEKYKPEIKSESKTTNLSHENIKILIKIAIALAGIGGATYLIYCLFHSASTPLRNDILSKMVNCLKRLFLP